MVRFIIRRFAYGLLVLLGVITVVFFLFNVLPGDPARMMLGQRADISTVESIQEELGLDKPLPIQYVNYLNDLSPISVHNSNNKESFFFLDNNKYAPYKKLISSGDHTIVLKYPFLRTSYQSNMPVSQMLLEAFPNTLILAAASMIFALIIGLLTGIICDVYNDSIFSKIVLMFSVTGMSLPSFFSAILIAWVFAYLLGDITGLNMVGNLIMVDDFGEGTYYECKNLILPAFTLGIRPLAIITELTRSSLLNVLSQDYIRTAKAKGLSFVRIIARHALKNALNPIITSTSGWFASLLAGAVFVEYVFDWKGIGSLIVKSLEYYDFPVLMGAVLLVAVMMVIVNILVDIIYGILDPRIVLK